MLRFLLVTIGSVAALAVGVILATGGFVTHVGAVRVSARGIGNPTLIGALAWLTLGWLERARLRAALHVSVPFLERHAAVVVCAMAAGCAGVGVAFGTFAAHATDPSAYVSHADLIARGDFVRTEPLARTFSAWHGGAWNFSPLGYRPGVAPAEIVPTYPLGLPAAIAVFRTFFGEFGGYFAVPVLGALLIAGCFALGQRLHSRLAGLVAASLAASSPILLFHVVQPMSDVPAATWLVLATVAALGSTRGSAVTAGVCLGLLGATRPNLAPMGLLVVACAAGWPLRDWRRWAPGRVGWVGLGLVPSLGPFMMLQARLYGSPFSTGYGSLDQYFSLANIGQNLHDYSWRIARGETPALALASVALVVLATHVAVGRSGTSPAEPAPTLRRLAERLRPSALVAGAGGALMLALYLPYGVFPDWAYLRFLLPGLALGFVVVGALAAEAATALPPGLRGVLLTAAVGVAIWQNVGIASREQVFRLHVYESRYRSVGRYLKETLPPKAVVVTFQESGAIRYYTGAPIVRWDYLPLGLDEAVELIRQQDRHPVLVVEDWERPNLTRRFPGSRLASLDWTPRADIGETTHVWILDPLDRETSAHTVTDRFR